MKSFENLNIGALNSVPPPEKIEQRLALSPAGAQMVDRGQVAIQSVLDWADPRLIAIAGSRAIHAVVAGTDYARRLKELSEDANDSLPIVMRLYFEKPRTSTGWKGYVNDPRVDNLVSRAATGARAAESQAHREMSSGPSAPVGFKNGAHASVEPAMSGIFSASRPRSVFGIKESVRPAIVNTRGNRCGRLGLRGDGGGPNHLGQMSG